MKTPISLPAIAKATSVVIILFSFFNQSVFAQRTIQKGYGIEGYERGNIVRQLPDGGFIIGGETQALNTTSNEMDMLLIRTDADGNFQWSKTYGGPEREVINDIAQTADNGFMMLAERYQPEKKEGEMLVLMKTDANGNIIWKQLFDEGGKETEGFTMKPTPDGGYIITGMTRDLNIVSTAFFNTSDRTPKLYLLKVDARGSKMWSRYLKFPDSGSATGGAHLNVMKDGSFIICGTHTPNSNTDQGQNYSTSLLLAKVKGDGTLIWTNTYGASNTFANSVSVIEKKEGGFMLVGNISQNQGDLNYCLMSIAADGTLQWTKAVGGPKYDSVSDVFQTADNGFIVIGSTDSYGSGLNDILIFKTNQSGDLLWAKTYGSKSNESAGPAIEVAGGIVMTGEVSMGAESIDVLLLRTDADGKSNCLGTSINPAITPISLTKTSVTGAALLAVQPAAANPNYKKPDLANILQQDKILRAKSMCQ